MPRYVNNPLIAKVHVIDANGDPVTGATVSVKVLDPDGQDWDGTWNANYYSDGVYYTEITPDRLAIGLLSSLAVTQNSAKPQFTTSAQWTFSSSRIGFTGSLFLQLRTNGILSAI